MAQQRIVRPGEAIALDSREIRRGADGFFFLVDGGSPENLTHPQYGNVEMVHVRGSLEHHETQAADNYECIVQRVDNAFSRDGVEAVMLCVDSRGGVVSGLNETVNKLRDMRKAADIPLIAFVNEMAASAAFALCCACDEILSPASAIIGSIGTISTMVSVKRQDEMGGIDVVLLTSGDRKADGHLHAAISDDAKASELVRVNKLANAFFQIVNEARGLSVKTIEKMQAAIFLGRDAYRRGLSDGVMSLDAAAGAISKRYAGTRPATSMPSAKGNETDRKAEDFPLIDREHAAPGTALPAAQSGTIPSTSAQAQVDTRGGNESGFASDVAEKAHAKAPDDQAKESPMLALAALIEKTEAAIKLATDPKKRARLQRDLASYQYTMIRAEGGEGDDEDDADEDDEGKAGAAHKMAERKAKKAEAAKHRADAAKHRAKAAEYEDKARAAEAEDDDDEEEAEEKTAAGAISADLSPAAAAAIAEQARVAEDALKRVRVLEAQDAKREQMALIETALAQQHISPAEAKMLRGKAPAWAKEYIETRGEVRVVNTTEGELLKPRESGNEKGGERAEVEHRVRMMGIKDTDPQFKTMVDEMISNRAKVATNGLGAIGWAPTPSGEPEVGRY